MPSPVDRQTRPNRFGKGSYRAKTGIAPRQNADASYNLASACLNNGVRQRSKSEIADNNDDLPFHLAWHQRCNR